MTVLAVFVASSPLLFAAVVTAWRWWRQDWDRALRRLVRLAADDERREAPRIGA